MILYKYEIVNLVYVTSLLKLKSINVTSLLKLNLIFAFSANLAFFS